MKDQTKLIAAILVGAAAGAVLGMLFAPDSGEGLRGDIADYVNDLVATAKEKTGSTVDNLKQYGSDTVDKVKSKFNGEVENAQDYANNSVGDAKSKVKATADNLNDSIQNA